MTRKVVIITGGAGGIGQELVSAFLADEALVISVDKKPVLDVGEHALHKSLAIDLRKSLLTSAIFRFRYQRFEAYYQRGLRK